MKIRVGPCLAIDFGFEIGLELNRRKERREADR